MRVPVPAPSRHLPHHLTQYNIWILCNENSLRCSLNSATVLSSGKQSFTTVVELSNPNSQLPFPRKATGLETAEGYSKAQTQGTLGSVQVRNLNFVFDPTSQHSQAVKKVQAISSFSLQFTFYFITGRPKRNTIILPHLFYSLGFLYQQRIDYIDHSGFITEILTPKFAASFLVNTECKTII